MTWEGSSSTNITIKWGPVPCADRNGNITSYVVMFRENGKEMFHNETPTRGDMEFTITGLQPSTEYEIKVAAFTVAVGPFTNESLFASTTGSYMLCIISVPCTFACYTDSPNIVVTTTEVSPPTTADTGEGGSNVGGIVAGVMVSVLLLIGATLGIIAAIWLMRRCRCALGMFFIPTLLCVLCRKKSTMKGLFSISHFKVTRKQSTLPHSRDTRDISLEQLSSESILLGTA